MSAAEAHPGADVNVPHNVASTASSGSEFVYYRVYHNYDAIATKQPAYSNDKYIGRIRSKWVAPPHTAGSLKLCLCSIENIDPEPTKLMASGSNQSALADEAPISLKTLGTIPEDPVILFSKALPQAPGTNSLHVAPDSKSPLAPRFLFYAVYSEVGAQASKDPIDAEQPWLSKIDLYLILPPVSVTSLLHILNMKEGINTSPQLLAQDGPLGDDQIYTKDGNWLGASAEDHLVLKFGRPPFSEGSLYRIQNCCTGKLLASSMNAGFVVSSAGYLNGSWKHFTLRLQDDGSVVFRNVRNVHGSIAFRKQYNYRSARNRITLKFYRPTTDETTRKFWLIPSTTNKNYFFICDDLVSRKAIYDAGASHDTFELSNLDPTDTRQMWSLIRERSLGRSVVSAVSRFFVK